MNTWTIYHNSKCSKSRQTLELLQEKGISPKIVEYLKEPVAANELKKLVKYLGISAKDLVRTKEAIFKELSIDLDDSSAVIKAMVENPKLIERPIVVKGEKAVLGRPPENVLKLL